MLSHTLTFQSFGDKRIAIDWIKENIEPEDENEALTELRYIFYTGVAPRKHTIDRMLREVPHKNYESHDL